MNENNLIAVRLSEQDYRHLMAAIKAARRWIAEFEADPFFQKMAERFGDPVAALPLIEQSIRAQVEPVTGRQLRFGTDAEIQAVAAEIEAELGETAP